MREEHEGALEGAVDRRVEDFFLADGFLVKGRVLGKHKHLSRILEETDRSFLEVRDAVMVDLRRNAEVQTPRLFVNLDQILLAHELVDMAGDYVRTQFARGRKRVHIRAFCAGPLNLEVAGLVSPGAWDRDPSVLRFIVVEQPVLRGLDLEARPELAALGKLPYVILHKHRIAYVYDHPA